MAALVNGSLSLEGLYAALGVGKTGKISEYSSDLVQAGFLSRDYTGDLKTADEGKHSTLRLSDNYLRRHLAYAWAPENLPPLLTARRCFEVHAGAKGLPAVGGELMALAEELKFLPYLEAFVDTLSLGTKQKLAILLCLIGDPKLIVLDEAFNGLDPASSLVLKRHLRRRLKDRGAALVLATHALDIVEHYADHAGLLLDGVLAREWTKSGIEELRSDGRGFDSALADLGNL